MGGGPVKDKLLISIPGKEPKAQIEKLKKKFPDIEVAYFQPNVELTFFNHKDVPREVWKDITILATFRSLPEKVSDAPKLDWAQFFSAGTNHIQDHPIYTDSDVILTTASGVHGPQLAEWVIGTALAHSHNLYGLYDQQKKAVWHREESFTVHDLVNQRLGVLGYGSIGRQVARLGKAMGMDVIAYTATPKETPEKRADNGYIVPGTGDPDGSIPSEWYYGLDKKSLHHFLEQDIDILLVSLPLTDDTKGMLSKEEFKILSRKKAFVSNISRGPIIDQPEIISALEDGLIRGAALDVTDPEPLPDGHPLWSAPNVIVTPHVSGNGVAYLDRAFGVLELNLEKRVKGEPLINVVDRKRGY